MNREKAERLRSLFWERRRTRKLSRAVVAELATPHAEDVVSEEYVRFVETQICSPPHDFGNLRAIALALGLGWDEVLATMGLR